MATSLGKLVALWALWDAWKKRNDPPSMARMLRIMRERNNLLMQRMTWEVRFSTKFPENLTDVINLDTGKPQDGWVDLGSTKSGVPIIVSKEQ